MVDLIGDIRDKKNCLCNKSNLKFWDFDSIRSVVFYMKSKFRWIKKILSFKDRLLIDWVCAGEYVYSNVVC